MQVFDTATRVIECAHCGAPLSGAEQSQVRCTYCGATNQLAARPRAAQTQRTPAQEIARLSSLKAQLEHPLSGHVYDMEALPPQLEALGVRSGSALAQLTTAWTRLKQSGAPTDLEVQRAMCWLALRCSRLLIDRDQATAARAKLETTLDSVSDDGLRQLVRCELALEATRRRELNSAKGWLAECDPAAEVLELDTCFRVATARVALLEDSPARALEVLGRAPGDVPLDAGWEQHISVVRTHACELLGHTPPGFLSAADLAFASRESLAPKARLASAEQHLRSLRAEQASIGSLRSTIMRSLLIAPWWSLLIAATTTSVGCVADTGPVFGATSDVVCARVCETCRGPYSNRHSTVNGNGTWTVACDNSLGSPKDVPGGGWTMLSIAFFAYYPLGVLVSLAYAIRGLKAGRDRVREKLPVLQAAEAKLRELGGDPSAAAATPTAKPKRGLLGWLLLLAPLLLLGSCAVINLGLRTP